MSDYLTREPKLPSERKFGLFFALVFLCVGVDGLFRARTFELTALLFILGAVFGILAFSRPTVLAPLNRAWFKFGILLGKIVSPLVLGLIFFVLLTPIAAIASALGRDELRLKKRNVSSYWIDRIPPGPEPESFKNQF